MDFQEPQLESDRECLGTSLMYENDFRPNTVEELQQKIVDTWQQITPAYTRDLVSSMPRRLQMVIDSNGAMTKYYYKLVYLYKSLLRVGQTRTFDNYF
jgi:hypothetical protein